MPSNMLRPLLRRQKTYLRTVRRRARRWSWVVRRLSGVTLRDCWILRRAVVAALYQVLACRAESIVVGGQRILYGQSTRYRHVAGAR